MSTPDPSHRDLASLIPRVHRDAKPKIVITILVLGLLVGFGGYRGAEWASAKLPSKVAKKPAKQTPPDPCASGSPLIAKAPPNPVETPLPDFDYERVNLDLEERIDVSSCHRSGGPTGPGLIHVKFEHDGHVRETDLRDGGSIGAFGADFSKHPLVAQCLKKLYGAARIAPFKGEMMNRTARVSFVLRGDGHAPAFDDLAAASALDHVNLDACRVKGSALKGNVVLALAPNGSVRVDDVTSGPASRCIEQAYRLVRVPAYAGVEMQTQWWFSLPPR